MSYSPKLDSDLASLILALDRLIPIYKKGREEATTQEHKLAYRRVGGALDRLITKAKIERKLNRQA